MLSSANLKQLSNLQSVFFTVYPNGWEDPDLVAALKKHRVGKRITDTQDAFKKTRFRDSSQVLEDMVKTVSRSSMVSLFEKPKFRDYVKHLTPKEGREISNALKERLHGDAHKGFDRMVNCLLTEKLAKWSLISIIPTYYAPEEEVFVKPTTAKNIINFFDLDLTYKPLPTWEFYQGYKRTITEMINHCDEHLSPSNAAFTGFLMITMDMLKKREGD